MKTVSTKLDKQDFEKFQEICNNEGQCMSESLRDLIKMDIQAYEEGLEMEKEEKTKPVLKHVEDIKTIPVAHGKILDDFGNVIGTF